MKRYTLAEGFLRPAPHMYGPDSFGVFLHAVEFVGEAETAEFIAAAQQMPYAEFLQTIYWQVIRGQICYLRGNACQGCLAQFGLQVHHQTYEIRGQEFCHLNCLDLLCGLCHKSRHQLTTAEEETKIRKRRMNAWQKRQNHERAVDDLQGFGGQQVMIGNLLRYL